MPPWHGVSATERACQQCGEAFMAKRNSAKFCSDLCRERSRPMRTYDAATSKPRRDRWMTINVEKVRQQGNARAAAIRTFLAAHKLKHGCADCGYRVHHAALDFDHVRGKKLLNVCNAKSIAQAESEIAKCEVVCSNCHRIRTYERIHEAKAGAA